MKILIVTPCGLPIPAVKGGAVLTLVESLLVQNEINSLAEFSVIGIYDEDAVNKSKDYSNTKFHFVKIPKLRRKIDALYETVYEKLTGKTHKNKKRYLGKLYTLGQIKKLLIKNDYDRVVFQNAGYLLNVLNNKKISKKYEGKLYYHLHNDIPQNINISCLKKCKLILISEYLKKGVYALCNGSFPQDMFVLKNGIDCSKYICELSNQEKVDLKNKLGIGEDKKIVLFVGRIDPTKGIEQLVGAMQKLNRDDVVLLVVGSHNFGSGQTSPFEQRMKGLFSTLSSKIVFTGYVPYADIWKYYKLADVAALPSMWEEPAGLTMIEAVASGTPLITTVSGGIPEYINKEYSILLPKDEAIVDAIADAINEVLNNYSLYIKRAEIACKEVVNLYSEEIFYNNFLKMIGCEK